MKKETYTREMLDHDYSDEAANYVDAGMSAREIAQDVRQIFADNYDVEDEDIVPDYIDNLLKEVEKQR